jgi:DNA-binding NarL/FixJ family response regulator
MVSETKPQAGGPNRTDASPGQQTADSLLLLLVDGNVETESRTLENVRQIRIALPSTHIPEDALGGLPIAVLQSSPAAIVVSGSSGPRVCRTAAHARAIWPDSLCLIASESFDRDLCRGALRVGAHLVPLPIQHCDLDIIMTASTEKFSSIGFTKFEARSARLHFRESQILALWRGGFSRKDIAGRLHISENTVKWYIRSMLQKMGVRRMSDLLRG